MNRPTYASFRSKAFSFNRQITSQRPSLPSGSVEGIAEFVPMPNQPSALLYKEQGTFHTDKQLTMQVSREYIWQFSTEALSIFFVKPSPSSDSKEKDYLFLELELPPEDSSAIMQAVHPCGQDMYRASYEFATPHDFLVRYQVEGPDKDYTSDTLYTLHGRVD